jgi:hypothetical protein
VIHENMSIMTEFFKKKFEGRNTKLIAWQHFFANEITMKKYVYYD